MAADTVIYAIVSEVEKRSPLEISWLHTLQNEITDV
jgi:hypothetical protein